MSSVNPSPVDAVPDGPGPSAGPEPAPASTRRVSFLNAPFTRRTYAELLYGFIGLPIAVLGFALSVVFVSLGLSTLVTFLGIFVLAFAIVLGRWLGAMDRGLINGLLDGRIQNPRRFKARRSGPVGWAISRLGDPVGWRGIAHQLVRLPLAVATFCFTVTFWAYTLAGLTYWIWYRFLPAQEGHDGQEHHGASLWNTSTSSYFLDTWPRVLVTALIGVVLLWLTPCRAPRGPVAVSQRVRELEQSRSDAVTTSNEQLRRIERDLHDGTQARLVALAMNLGQAKEDLSSDDPAAAERVRALIEGAHQQTKET